jgi:hypothetical protein
MSSILGAVKDRAQYAFFGAGIVWLALAVYEGSLLLLWPVVALLAGGAMLRFLPGKRLTWAWLISASLLGLVVSLYQVFVSVPLLGGAFTLVAASSLVIFAVFGAAHVVLGYAGAAASKGS